MPNNLTLSKAKPTDAKAAVRLIALADEDAVMAISGKPTLAEALAKYEQDFTRTDVYSSYQNVIVARINNEVVGCILYFNGADEERYVSFYSPGGDYPRESDNDEIYIDSLAVDSNHRGSGIAKHLVQAVITEATARGVSKVGLLADVTKPHLGKFYRNIGFMETKRMRYLNDEYEKLVYYIAYSHGLAA